MNTMPGAVALIALDAVVLDTETTGLDPRHARIVEIGAVRIDRGRAGTRTFAARVNPGAPIPESARLIHGIDDAAVAQAPDFAAVWPQLCDFIDNRILIGHTLGFDMAVLRRESERAALRFAPHPFLDTRLLAQVVAPDLAAYTIESLSAWLGVEVEHRHSALGDATTTARLFLALVPRLRDAGIRTVAEASAACRALTDVLDQQNRAGWAETSGVGNPEHAESALERFDSYPYRHRVADVMNAPARFIAADRNLEEALAVLTRERVSSLYVRPAERDATDLRPQETGIVTERDLLRGLAEHGPRAFAMRISDFMSRPLAAVPAEAFVYRAIGRMGRLGTRHLGVVDEIGRVIGAVSARDLLRLRAGAAVMLGDEINQAQDVQALAAAWATLPQATASLLAEGICARDIAAVISSELGALTRQAAILAERRLGEKGFGAPPCPYTVVVLGSAGRGESLLAMDQDNAIIFAEGEPDGPQDRWFAQLGAVLADILHEAGVPYCPGGVMAKNASWRGSARTWGERVDSWVRRSRPQDLLSIDIFFDLRGVCGDLHLGEDLRRRAFDVVRGQTDFVKLLAEAAGEFDNALGWFGRIKSDNGRLDLKSHGLFPVVTAARLLAIRFHILDRETPARLAGVRSLGIGAGHDLEALDAAHATFLHLVLAQQIEDIARGSRPNNSIALKRLDARVRARLHDALQTVGPLNVLIHDLLFS